MINFSKLFDDYSWSVYPLIFLILYQVGIFKSFLAAIAAQFVAMSIFRSVGLCVASNSMQHSAIVYYLQMYTITVQMYMYA